jgi:hypothetical protein
VTQRPNHLSPPPLSLTETMPFHKSDRSIERVSAQDRVLSVILFGTHLCHLESNLTVLLSRPFAAISGLSLSAPSM